MRKKFMAVVLVASMAATSAVAGAIVPAPRVESNNNNDLLIGAVVIGLLVWALSAGSAGAGGSGYASSKGSKSGAGQGKVLEKF